MSISNSVVQELKGKLQLKYHLKGFDLPVVVIDGVENGGELSLSSIPASGLKITIPAGGPSGPSGHGILLLVGLGTGHEIERGINKVVDQEVVEIISLVELSAIVGQEVYVVYTVADEGSQVFLMRLVS